MKFVPVVDKNNNSLMPCHAARARELVKKGKAIRRFNKGIFYIKLLNREGGEIQPVAVGVDPGSKKEAFTVKSESHTYLNIQSDAVNWVGKKVEERRNLRRSRRHRNTPYRQCRSNRGKDTFLPPGTKARWQLKLRILKWITKLYPVSVVIIEDIAAVTRSGKKHWNKSFSPLEVGKAWFYGEVQKLAELKTIKGYETAQLRQGLGLKKSSQKLSNKFEAHCVDSWVLANNETGGHLAPDHKTILFLIPLKLHRRNLHRQNPQKGGVRPPYGGTRSLGFKRGSWVKHPECGLCYVGGSSKGRISLHSLETGKRLSQKVKPADCQFLCYSSFRLMKGG